VAGKKEEQATCTPFLSGVGGALGGGGQGVEEEVHTEGLSGLRTKRDEAVLCGVVNPRVNNLSPPSYRVTEVSSGAFPLLHRVPAALVTM